MLSSANRMAGDSNNRHNLTRAISVDSARSQRELVVRPSSKKRPKAFSYHRHRYRDQRATVTPRVAKMGECLHCGKGGGGVQLLGYGPQVRRSKCSDGASSNAESSCSVACTAVAKSVERFPRKKLPMRALLQTCCSTGTSVL